MLNFLTLTVAAFVLSFSVPAVSQQPIQSVERLTDKNVYDVAQSFRIEGEPYSIYVKFAVLLNENGGLKEIVYQNSRDFLFHADYLSTRPEFRGFTREQIDRVTLKAENRRAFIGTLFMRDQLIDNKKAADFEIVSNSEISVEDTLAVYNMVRASVDNDLVEMIQYAPVPDLRSSAERMRETLLKAGLRLAVADSTATMKVYTQAWTVGRIRRMSAEQATEMAKRGLIAQTDILVVDKVPRELPPVAGVISATQTAPSSHVALLTRMFDVPFVFQKDAMDNPLWKRLNDKTIALRPNGHQIEVSDKLTTKEIAKLIEIKFGREPYSPSIDTVTSAIVSPKTLERTSIATYGGKSSQLGYIVRLFPNNSPQDALAIPIHYYSRYLDEAEVRPGLKLGNFLAEKLKSIAPLETEQPKILATLKEIRNAFKRTPIPKAILSEIETILKPAFPGEQIRLKLRSSSNAEDKEDFNGAGLYDSEGAWLRGAPIAERDETVERALRKVWGSLFTDRGYLARRTFRFEEAKVGMGILVTRAHKNELANGVMVTKVRHQSVEALVTGFPGEDLDVTHPPDGKLPETMGVVPTGENRFELNKVQSSTEIPRGRDLLNASEYEELVKMATEIQNRWPNATETLQLDFEWKIMATSEGGRQVVLKQVRPIPLPRQPKPGHNSGFTLIGKRDLRMITGAPEGSDSLEEMQRMPGVTLRIGNTTQNELDEGIFNIEYAKLYGRLSTYRFKQPKARIEKKVSTRGSSGETAEYTVYIAVPNPELPSLEVKLTFSNLIWEDNRYQLNSLLMMSDVDTSFYVSDSKDMIRYRTQDPVFGDGDPYWRLRSTNESRHLAPIKRIPFNEIYSSEAVTVQIGGFNLYSSPWQKTVFRRLEEARVKGLLARDLVIRKPTKMNYSPAHHNFDFQFAIDLFAAEDLTDLEKKELNSKGGRYLIIGSLGTDVQSPDPNELRHTIGLWSELGVRKSLGFASEDYPSPLSGLP